MNAAILDLLSLVYNRPLMLSPEKLAVICGVLQARYRLDMVPCAVTLDADMATHALSAIPQAKTAAGYSVMSNGTAVIPVAGSLAHRRGGMVAPESGMMSYDGIRGMFRAAMADPAVSQIILDVNSHGGEVHGVFDLAAEIFAGRHQKQSMAVINETGASAAYLLASACNIVVMPENGMAGSVGIVMRHVDMSKLNEKEGVAVSYIYAGAKKVQGHPDAALSDGDRADLQSRVDEVYAQFVTTVAKYRGMRPEAVRATEAAVFRGQAAEAVGLTDDTLPAGEAYDMGPVALGAALAKYKFPPGG